MTYKIYSPEDFKIVPWKNGLGKTTELIAGYVPGSEHFAWRLSIAGVVNDDPFSDFSGYDRILVLMEGNGVALEHSYGQKDILKKRFDTACFSGDWKTNAKLADGPIKDFNIMTRRDLCSAKVEIFKSGGRHKLGTASDIILIYSFDESINISNNSGDSVQLLPDHLFYTDEKMDSDFTISGTAAIVAVITFK